jgi:small subunit ribosomal protein S13
VDIPDNKKCDVALTYIYGIGRSSGRKIVEKAGLAPETKIKDLAEADLDKIRKVIDNDYTIEGGLRAVVRMNIKRLMDIGSYTGLRHRRGLPVHGQRTRTNARTRKGPARTIAGKKRAVK